MKIFLKCTLVSFLFCSCFCSAQNLDSLWKIYRDKNQSDTNRLNAIFEIAWSFKTNNPDTAIILAEEELKLANSLPGDKGKDWAAKAFRTIGAAFDSKGNLPKELEYFLKALKLFQETGNKRGIAGCYRNIGWVYLYESSFPKALEYTYKALKIYEEMSFKEGIGNCYTDIGNIYQKQTDFPKALEFYLKSLTFLEEVGNKQGIASCYMNIAFCYGC